MAKKKAARKTSRARVPFQIRLKPTVHETISKMAEAGGVSMNQLTEGLLDACARYLQPGRPLRVAGEVVSMPDPGCYYVGMRSRKFKYVAPGEPWPVPNSFVGADGPRHEWQPEPVVPTDDPADDGKIATKGFVWFILDYSQEPVEVWEDEDEE